MIINNFSNSLKFVITKISESYVKSKKIIYNAPKKNHVSFVLMKTATNT